MTVYETDEIIERVILVGVAFDTDDDTERSLDELGELAKTAGAQTVGRMIQTRDNFHPATYIGKGKIEELRLMIDELDATGIICDDELSPPSSSSRFLNWAGLNSSHICGKGYIE